MIKKIESVLTLKERQIPTQRNDTDQLTQKYQPTLTLTCLFSCYNLFANIGLSSILTTTSIEKAG